MGVVSHAMTKSGLSASLLINKDSLANYSFRTGLEDRYGNLWFGSRRRHGVFRYDGQNFVNFTTDDGLAHNAVSSILEDGEGGYGSVEEASSVGMTARAGHPSIPMVR